MKVLPGYDTVPKGAFAHPSRRKYMTSESMTLYKLMILYMLKQVKFPLTNANFSEFFVGKYTTYFVLQQALSELLESHLLTMESINNSTRYEMTKEGDEALSFFVNKISPGSIEDMNEFIRENKFRMRNEVSTTGEFYRSSHGEIILHCQVLEGRTPLIELNMTIPDEAQAALMANNWKGASQDIYQYVVKRLLEG